MVLFNAQATMTVKLMEYQFREHLIVTRLFTLLTHVRGITVIKNQIVQSSKMKIVILVTNWLIFTIKNSELKTEDRILFQQRIDALLKDVCNRSPKL